MADFEDAGLEREIDIIAANLLNDQVRGLHDDIASFRADAIGKLQRIGQNTERCWALFKTFKNPEGYYGLPSTIPTDTLLLKYLPEFERPIHIIPPSIRIITTEAIQTKLGVEFLVQDVTVDYEGDSQYFVDLIADEHIKDDDPDSTDDKDYKSDSRGFRNPKLSVPIVHNGELVFYYRKPMDITPCVTVDGDFSSPMPFGVHNNIWDKRYALNKAIELFANIAYIDPDETGELQSLLH